MAEDRSNNPSPPVEEEEEGVSEEQVCQMGAPMWVVTFGDMMSLLLTFFILLLSFATMDKVQFSKLSGILKEGFGSFSRTNSPRIPKADSITRSIPRIQNNSKARSSGEDLRQSLQQLQSSSSRDVAQVNVEIFKNYRDLKVLIPADDVFVPGTDQIQTRFKPILKLLAAQAREMTDRVFAVEVRSAPDGPQSFSDPWEMTAYQSIALSNFLQTEGQLSAAKIEPIGRGVAPLSFVGREESERKRGSTVEFIYVAPTKYPNQPE